MDGYSDPTERDNTMFSANLINEFDVPFLNGSAKHTLMVGAEAISTDNENFRYNTFWSTTLDDNEVFNVTNPMNFSVNANGDATTNNFTADLNNSTTSAISVTSVFVQDQIDLTDNFKVMLGFRHDNFDISVTDVIANNTTSKVDENVSPRLGLIYKPMEDMSVYYSYSESFLPRSGEQFKKHKESDSRLDADVFESTEFGLKWSLSNNLSLTASLFESEQVRAARDSDTGETSEVIGLTVEGFEVELKGQLSDNLSVHAGYSSLDGVTAKGGEPREIPTHTFNAFAQYIVSENFGWGIGFTQQGESYIKNDDTSKVLPEYTRIDFSAYYDVSDDVSIRMNIENVGDEVYFPHSHSSHQVTVGESVNARFSVTRRF